MPVGLGTTCEIGWHQSGWGVRRGGAEGILVGGVDTLEGSNGCAQLRLEIVHTISNLAYYWKIRGADLRIMKV